MVGRDSGCLDGSCEARDWLDSLLSKVLAGRGCEDFDRMVWRGCICEVSTRVEIGDSDIKIDCLLHLYSPCPRLGRRIHSSGHRVNTPGPNVAYIHPHAPPDPRWRSYPALVCPLNCYLVTLGMRLGLAALEPGGNGATFSLFITNCTCVCHGARVKIHLPLW